MTDPPRAQVHCRATLLSTFPRQDPPLSRKLLPSRRRALHTGDQYGFFSSAFRRSCPTAVNLRSQTQQKRPHPPPPASRTTQPHVPLTRHRFDVVVLPHACELRTATDTFEPKKRDDESSTTLVLLLTADSAAHLALNTQYAFWPAIKIIRPSPSLPAHGVRQPIWATAKGSRLISMVKVRRVSCASGALQFSVVGQSGISSPAFLLGQVACPFYPGWQITFNCLYDDTALISPQSL